MNTLLIKVGGSILNDQELITSLCLDLQQIHQAGYKIILVHGGSKAINKALQAEGIASEFIDGLRVTSAAAIKIIKNVLCEQVNQTLVNQLNHFGINAVGLSGADQLMLLCDYYSKEHGYVGEIKAVNTDIFYQLLSFQYLQPSSIPVIATLGVDDHGNFLNINADMAACHIANALQVDQVIYLTDQDGIYDQDGTTYSNLSAEDLQSLINQSIVSGGMLVKVKAIMSSLKAGLNHILVLNGTKKQILVDAVLHSQKEGTLCETRISPTHHLKLNLGVTYDTSN